MTEPPDDEPPKQQIRFRLGQPVPEHVLHPSRRTESWRRGTRRRSALARRAEAWARRRSAPVSGVRLSLVEDHDSADVGLLHCLPVAVVVAVLIVNVLNHRSPGRDDR